MSPRGADSNTDRTASEVIDGLRNIGYRGSLLETDYRFPDWFDRKQERTAVAAAFGQTPASYESACIGVARSNGLREQALVNGFRALGAPFLLEIDQGVVREWAVARTADRHNLVASYPADQIRSAFARRAQDWKPEALLRAKNIGSFQWTPQLSLFSGLLPELETQIADELDPLLQEILSATRAAYVESAKRQPNPNQLFQLVFWILTAKVFHDRRLHEFLALSSDPDDLLRAVANHYGESEIPRLLNREARQAASALAWNSLDFRNLSVEVLSQIWSQTLVDPATRRKLGIHRTPRTIVRYIEERIPFSPSGDDNRIVFEPCCGSAAFLVGAMNRLRRDLFLESASERHAYFVRHLAGVELDPFAVSISTLALTLADFPNPNGWNISQRDVFVPGEMADYLKRAAVVLCNPPFERFTAEERARYGASAHLKPAELLNRVLDDLSPGGVLGFVLPFTVVDGRHYAPVRKRLAERFACLDFTVLPDRAFESDVEVALLIATDPVPHDAVRVSYRRVHDDRESWTAFEREHKTSATYETNVSVHDAPSGFSLPDLPEVWSYLAHHPRLGDVAALHRGLEWKASHDRDSALIRRDPAVGYARGVTPQTTFDVFEVPPMSYLSLRPSDLRRGGGWPWQRPKAIFNKSTHSRGPWRVAAFPDREGVVCFQTFFGAWPQSDEYDEVVLAAILNSPVANAFIATREGKIDITRQTLLLVPVPILTADQRSRLHLLVARYQIATKDIALSRNDSEDPERMLKEIDALILDGYRLPPRLERQILDYFRGHARPVSHPFTDYIPEDHEFYFSLSAYLDPGFANRNVGRLLRIVENE